MLSSSTFLFQIYSKYNLGMHLKYILRPLGPASIPFVCTGHFPWLPYRYYRNDYQNCIEVSVISNKVTRHCNVDFGKKTKEINVLLH